MFIKVYFTIIKIVFGSQFNLNIEGSMNTDDVYGPKWLKDRVDKFLVEELSKYNFILECHVKLNENIPKECLKCDDFPACGKVCVYKNNSHHKTIQ